MCVGVVGAFVEGEFHDEAEKDEFVVEPERHEVGGGCW